MTPRRFAMPCSFSSRKTARRYGFQGLLNLHSLALRFQGFAALANARTIPYEDLSLISQAVIDGKPEPIDQYVRLRSLSGWSGNFTKLGITGLPLTTVFLTLVFSAISLTGLSHSEEFLDLAKLTLGAFIGSFVQRQVEQRQQAKSETDAQSGRSSASSLPPELR